MSLHKVLTTSSEGNREISDAGEIQQLLSLAMEHRWAFSYLEVEGNHVTSHEMEMVSLGNNQLGFTVDGKFPQSETAIRNAMLLRANSGGMSMVFKTEFISAATNFSHTECQFRVPQSLSFSQLRSAIRVNIRDVEDIPVVFHADTDSIFTGKVSDLSECGAKIKFNGDLSSHLNHSDIVADCEMLLPDEAMVDSRVQVLGCVYDQEQDASFVRCQFLELHDNSELQLHQLIYKAMQRTEESNLALAS